MAAGDRWRAEVGEGAFSPHFHAASELIGKRWTGAVLRALFHGQTRFREIADTIPDISDRLLSERLKELTEHGIVERAEDGRAYRLTDKGRDLRLILIEIARWAHRWDTSRSEERTTEPSADGAARTGVKSNPVAGSRA